MVSRIYLASSELHLKCCYFSCMHFSIMFFTKAHLFSISHHGQPTNQTIFNVQQKRKVANKFLIFVNSLFVIIRSITSSHQKAIEFNCSKGSLTSFPGVGVIKQLAFLLNFHVLLAGLAVNCFSLSNSFSRCCSLSNSSFCLFCCSLSALFFNFDVFS